MSGLVVKSNVPQASNPKRKREFRQRTIGHLQASGLAEPVRVVSIV